MFTILLWILFGALVGWLAGKIMKSRNSFWINVLLGIVGSIVGGFVASLLGFGALGAGLNFNIPNIIISVAGACIVIFLARALKIGGR